jgi:hypothetical protein
MSVLSHSLAKHGKPPPTGPLYQHASQRLNTRCVYQACRSVEQGHLPGCMLETVSDVPADICLGVVSLKLTVRRPAPRGRAVIQHVISVIQHFDRPLRSCCRDNSRCNGPGLGQPPSRNRAKISHVEKRTKSDTSCADYSTWTQRPAENPPDALLHIFIASLSPSVTHGPAPAAGTSTSFLTLSLPLALCLAHQEHISPRSSFQRKNSKLTARRRIPRRGRHPGGGRRRR